MSTDTNTRNDEATDAELALNDGDWGRDLAHHVPKKGLMEAMIYGTPVTALCGWRLIPRRDPQRFPVCPRCAEIHAHLPEGGGDD